MNAMIALASRKTTNAITHTTNPFWNFCFPSSPPKAAISAQNKIPIPKIVAPKLKMLLKIALTNFFEEIQTVQKHQQHIAVIPLTKLSNLSFVSLLYSI
jgi:hypothetical protein